MRNITRAFNLSNSCILSKDDVYAVAGVRQVLVTIMATKLQNLICVLQELLLWALESGQLVKRMTAHFQRIVEIQSLVGNDNCVITSSVDRSIKAGDCTEENYCDQLRCSRFGISTSFSSLSTT